MGAMTTGADPVLRHAASARTGGSRRPLRRPGTRVLHAAIWLPALPSPSARVLGGLRG